MGFKNQSSTGVTLIRQKSQINSVKILVFEQPVPPCSFSLHEYEKSKQKLGLCHPLWDNYKQRGKHITSHTQKQSFIWGFWIWLLDLRNAEMQITSFYCGSSIPALKTMGIDSWSPHTHSKVQTEDYQSIYSQYCLHTSSILKRRKKKLRHVTAIFYSGISKTYRILMTSCCLRSWDSKMTEYSLSYSVSHEDISWRHGDDEFTTMSSLSSPNDPHLLEQLWTAGLGPPTHWGIFRPKHRTKLDFSNRKRMQSM